MKKISRCSCGEEKPRSYAKCHECWRRTPFSERMLIFAIRKTAGDKQSLRQLGR